MFFVVVLFSVLLLLFFGWLVGLVWVFWLLHVAVLSHEYEYSALAKSGAVGGKSVAQCMT